MSKVLITDKINDLAVQIIARVAEADNFLTMDEEELCKVIEKYDAILVRSQTKITSKVIEFAKNLKIIARAGVGVDNIDINAATQKGIIVVNSPDGNTHAAAEHTIAMMMAMARNIPSADASVKKGLWERSKFTGVEVYNKTLGIIGLGKIGSHVANVAIAFGMNVIVYDPYTNREIVEKIGAKYVEHLDEFWGVCDFITIHTPKTKETTGLINVNTLNRMKKGVRIINCARGGIIDENALKDAIESGIVAGAAIDVYGVEHDILVKYTITHIKFSGGGGSGFQNFTTAHFIKDNGLVGRVYGNDNNIKLGGIEIQVEESILEHGTDIKVDADKTLPFAFNNVNMGDNQNGSGNSRRFDLTDGYEEQVQV